MRASHVIAAIVVVGLVIYFFSKRTVSGTITVGEGTVTGSSDGTVSYGTELK